MAVQSKKEPDSFLTKSWKCPPSVQGSSLPEVRDARSMSGFTMARRWRYQEGSLVSLISIPRGVVFPGIHVVET